MKLLPLAAIVNIIIYYVYRVDRGEKAWQKLSKIRKLGEEGQNFAILSEPSTAYQFQMQKEFFLLC